MLQLKNSSPFAAAPCMIPDRDAVDTVFVSVKGTFTLSARPRIASEQVPIVMAPEFHGDPLRSSIKRDGDLGLAKPATDVVLYGHACARAGHREYSVDVTVEVGPVRTAARVFGDRFWRAGAAGVTLDAPQLLEMIPLVWERTFGGFDESGDEPAADPRNPAGVGFRVRKGEPPADGSAAPNVEDPGALITSWRDRPRPVGFAPLAPHWEPRASYAGTYDDAWQRSRAPYLPADFDDRFLQVAPADLVVPGYLAGGEPIRLDGVSPHGTIESRVPSTRVRVEVVVDGSVVQPVVRLETLALEPDAERMTVTWKAAVSCDKRLLRVSEIRVFADGIV